MQTSLLTRRVARSASDFLLGIVFASCFLVVIVLDADSAWPAQLDNPGHHPALGAIVDKPNVRANESAAGAASVTPRPPLPLHYERRSVLPAGALDGDEQIFGEATMNMAVLPVAFPTGEVPRLLMLALIGILFAGMCTMILAFFRHLRRVLSMPRTVQWGRR